MLTLVVLAALQVAAQPQECKSAYGKTACGYQCLAAYGDVKCAHHPEASCKAAYGEVACGFDCTAAYGKVRCALEPGGVCQAAYGDVVCSAASPGRDQRWGRHRPWRAELPPQECKSAYGKTACGHHCVAAFGDLKCARTHLGACEVAFGRITCNDPPRWVLEDPAAPPMQCRTAYGKTACGYGCQAGYGDVRCAATPDGACQASFGQIVCSE